MRSVDTPGDVGVDGWARADLEERRFFAVAPDVSSRPCAGTATVCQVLHALGVGGAEILAARLARKLNSDYRFLFICLDELGSLGLELQR